MGRHNDAACDQKVGGESVVKLVDVGTDGHFLVFEQHDEVPKLCHVGTT